MDDQRKSNAKTGMIGLVVLVLLAVGIVVSIPLIARLYMWGFGG